MLHAADITPSDQPLPWRASISAQSLENWRETASFFRFNFTNDFTKYFQAHDNPATESP